MPQPHRQLSPERKALYYLGTGLAVFGLILFLSTFLSAALNFGRFDDFEARGQSMALRAVGGMILIMAGGFIHGIGKQGLAGSGIVPDPEQARRDVEPWSRMSGGVLQDTISEVGIVRKLEERLEAQPEIKLRCRQCQTLNDETAKFCNQCGAAI